ncbi:unnamed protein product, partial [Gongylonema pulchrum]|uniref:Piwi domain-containing protein n=1 Tax=Gongylonema pulchrum TaxID=637853 RepID=A0A183EZK3_9BILA
MVDPVIKNVAFEDLENSFKQIRDMYRNQQPFVIYVDSRDGTHVRMKCIFFSGNKWITMGKTLIIGYDVCHPEPQSKYERRLKIPPSQPSVLGISFNGAVCAETFIGDYAYQEPRQERVTGSILEERIGWILNLFWLNRNTLPETVIITRDGVSEGQFRM